jgi:hypothetical protein
MIFTFSMHGCGSGNAESSTAASTGGSSDRCPHDIKAEKCPFCTPALIESEGFCGEHGVAEALCYMCRPYLKAAFRAKDDWCAEHNAPDSQCMVCHPELKEKINTEAGHGAAHSDAGSAVASAPGNCEHGIAQAKCPFCTPSLIESEGFCGGHNVAEALCVKCRPFLEVAFKAKGDWCAEHNTPESQCVVCNPRLNKPSASSG